MPMLILDLLVFFALIFIYRRTRNVLICASVFAGWGFIEYLLDGIMPLPALELAFFSFFVSCVIFWIAHKFFVHLMVQNGDKSKRKIAIFILFLLVFVVYYFIFDIFFFFAPKHCRDLGELQGRGCALYSETEKETMKKECESGLFGESILQLPLSKKMTLYVCRPGFID